MKLFQESRIEILELTLKNKGGQLEMQWKIADENGTHEIEFCNVSRLSFQDLSVPLIVHGFEIIDHSQEGWEKESTYEIRDFEEDRVRFFCEKFKAAKWQQNPEKQENA